MSFCYAFSLKFSTNSMIFLIPDAILVEDKEALQLLMKDPILAQIQCYAAD